MDRARGRDAVVFGYGPWLLANAFEAADEARAEQRRVSMRLVNLPWLNRVDAAWLRDVVGGRRSIVTLDNHYLQGGQGEMVAAAIAALGLEPAARVTSRRRDGAAGVRHQRRSARAPRAGRRGDASSRSVGTRARVAPGQTRMTVLFWDIDGTLLTTGKGGRVRRGSRRSARSPAATSSCAASAFPG